MPPFVSGCRKRFVGSLEIVSQITPGSSFLLCPRALDIWQSINVPILKVLF